MLLQKIAEKIGNVDKEKVSKFAPKMAEMLATKTIANETNELAIRKALSAAYSYMSEDLLAARTLADMHLEQAKE